MSDPVDPFEAVKKFWGAFGLPLGAQVGAPGAMPSMPAGLGPIPGMVMPTFDIGEIDKRIGELKSVESWLSLNIEMVRTTIHGLEAQKATLGAFKAMQQPVQPPAAPAPAKRRRTRTAPKP